MKNLIFTLLLVTPTLLFCQPIKVHIILDKSGSMFFYDDKPKENDIYPLLEYIKVNGGELALSIIGNDSKYYLVRYRNNGSNCLGDIPKKKPGMSSREFTVLLTKYYEQKRKCGNTGSISSFLNSKDVKKIFGNSFSGSSDVAGAVELSAIYLNEVDKTLPSNMKRYSILVTDGQNNVSTYSAPKSFCCNMIVVHRSNNVGVLNNYNHTVTTSLRSAVNSIIK